MKTDITFLGVVRRVIGAKVFVEISSEQIPSASPIIHGRIYRLGQIGSFVRIPLGFLNLYGIVSMVGASENSPQDELDIPFSHGQRWIEIQLVGESYGTEEFQRGISIYPTIDDEVHIVTEENLGQIYGTSNPSMVTIGTHAASESLVASINIDKIISRHGAIIGSTGSGKSNTVAALLKKLTDGNFPSARIVVIDPHGEYATALKDRAKVFSINDHTNPLIIPYWAMSYDELAWFFIGRKGVSEDIRDLTLRDKIFEMKRNGISSLKAGAVSENKITPDSPIPFNIRQLWYDFDRPERVTYDDKDRKVEALIEEGDPENLISAKFKPHDPYNRAPYKANVGVSTLSYANKIHARLKDQRFKFLLDIESYTGKEGSKDLHDLLMDWIDHEEAVTILDLGGVPFEVIDLVVGVVTRIIFEGMFYGRDMDGIGKKRPLLLVYEEAHTYLKKSENTQFIAGYAKNAVRRVFKEGRKYGIGAIVVSQRPSELDDTILSQCGTFFALRLTNSNDQGQIRSTVPDALAGLIELLPALRTGEALVLGEAIQIPSRIRIPIVEPRPHSNDPETAKLWKKDRVQNPPYDKAVTCWRCHEL
ncbi:MAG: ATP-binding protein [Spirochaetes bacterium]|nr:ATP-binding protein [Spirochaetota bacterium]